MNYKPDQQELMAYLYDELDAQAKAKVEQYLLENPAVREELEQLGGVSKLLGNLKDKEVIAPPLFIPEPVHRFWDAPYFKTIVSIAASLIIVILVGRFAGTNVVVSDGELKLSFGQRSSVKETPKVELTPDQVQQMINQSLQANNTQLNTSWEESQQRLEKSIQTNLVQNSFKMDELVKQVSSASKDQVQQYVSTLQEENVKMVKDYFTLTSTEQKQYIEGLLVDFAKYLQQQRKDDLQLVQMRINNLEKNTNVLKQETEQILTSIISGSGTPLKSETKY
jgi:hypothetical protein